MALTPQTIRYDLKCGKGSISPGEKCHVGTAQTVDNPRRTLTGENGVFSRKRIAREGYYGAELGGDPFSRRSQANRMGAFNAGLGAVAGGIAGGLIGGGKKSVVTGALIGGAYGALGGGAGGAIGAQVNRMTSRAANRSLQREAFEKPLAQEYGRKSAQMRAAGASRKQLSEYDQKTALKLARGYDEIQRRTRGRYGTDSVWAYGF